MLEVRGGVGLILLGALIRREKESPGPIYFDLEYFLFPVFGLDFRFHLNPQVAFVASRIHTPSAVIS